MDHIEEEAETTSYEYEYEYLPPSMLSKRLNWDVFLSFRGEDTRRTITKSLYDALGSNGVRTFIDDEGMERGDVIQPSLEEAIVDSSLVIAILSPRYGDSRWCLHELSRIFQCSKRVVPVFYRVDPSDIRRQRGAFGQGFRKLIDSLAPGFDKSEVQTWRDVLNKVGNISGYPCNHERDEPELIQRIVKQVTSELKNTPEYVVKLAVGLDSRVDKVLQRLDLGFNGVRFLCIHGTPGIGKTTLAKALFNKLVTHFKRRCFVSNVRERLANKGGVLSIMNKLIIDLTIRKKAQVNEEAAGKKVIQEILNENRVLVVLDDVSEANQLENLGIVRDWFKGGSSRLIVTSRNMVLLHEELYEAEKLDESESLELFSIHALGRREPTPEFQNDSKKIVSLANGLPLALEIFGSNLVKKTKAEWEDFLEKLRQVRPNKLQDVLKLSYDGLDEQEKTVFLDISCLLLQTKMKKEEVVDVLEGCDLKAEIAIGNLVSKSLMKIMKDGSLWMHDQIRDMGRQIVIEECFDDPGKHSRLWDSKDIMHVLRHERGTKAIRGIVLDTKKPPDPSKEMMLGINFRRHLNVTTAVSYLKEKFKVLASRVPTNNDHPIISMKSFAKMVNLKLLRINYVKLQGDFKNIPTELRWLQWKGCPQMTLPFDISEEIRVLDLSESMIQGFWRSSWFCLGNKKVAANLVVLNLSHCPFLTALPDMSKYKHLKKLILELCVRLTEIHESVGNLSSLVHVNLKYCSSFVDFPREVTGMKALKELILTDCSEFKALPNDVRSMKSLTRLFLDRTTISQLPEYLFHLTQLKVLCLINCKRIRILPECLGALISLEELILDGTGLPELPKSTGSLTSLETLSLMRCKSLTTLPDSMGNLKSLVNLFLNASSIQQLHDSICSISYLKVLKVGGCSLSALPPSINGLASILELELDKTFITELPHQIGLLKFIKKLHMRGCASLKSLPESMGGMSNLTILVIVGAAITKLPKSIGGLKNLVFLNLNQCRELCELPDSIGDLRSLERFTMEETAVTKLPKTFGLLKCLRVLKMKKTQPTRTQIRTDANDSPNQTLHGFNALPASFCNLSVLQEFNAQACRISGKIDDNFCKLSKLEILNLSYNDFHSLPSSLEGLCVLGKLLLRHCEELRFLPRLSSTLVELIAADCYALESICDLSNLERLEELQLANCNKLKDVPGLECLKSLRRLYLGGCNVAKPAIQRRLSRVALRNLSNLSMPGSQIPDWFSQKPVNFTTRPNLAIKSVVVGVIISVDFTKLDNIRTQLPDIIDIQARILRQETPIFTTVLNLHGVPNTTEDQLYLCRFKYNRPLVLSLQEGDTIEVLRQPGEIHGIELKRWGIYLVYENDDDYEGDEDILTLDESQQSISQKPRLHGYGHRHGYDYGYGHGDTAMKKT